MKEIDLVDGGLSGLNLGEMEFPNETSAHDFKPPEWFGEDLTENKSYKNQQLAAYGLLAQR